MLVTEEVRSSTSKVSVLGEDHPAAVLSHCVVFDFVYVLPAPHHQIWGGWEEGPCAVTAVGWANDERQSWYPPRLTVP